MTQKGKISRKVLRDIYKMREIFERMLNDYHNDRAPDRAEKIIKSAKEGIDLTNDYINNNPPIS